MKSTYRSYNTWAHYSHQTSGPTPSSTQYTDPASYTSSAVYQTKAESAIDHRYHQVFRDWTLQGFEQKQTAGNPSSSYGFSQNYSQLYDYGFDRYAPRTYPEQMVSSQGRSRQLTTENLEGYDRQTLKSSNMVRWAQQSQREEPWNGIGAVRKRSEYDPCNTKL